MVCPRAQNNNNVNSSHLLSLKCPCITLTALSITFYFFQLEIKPICEQLDLFIGRRKQMTETSSILESMFRRYLQMTRYGFCRKFALA